LTLGPPRENVIVRKHRPSCTVCAGSIYYGKFDAYGCFCKRWLEDKCSDTGCEYCAFRPDVPPED
jgi:hypothetical protein